MISGQMSMNAICALADDPSTRTPLHPSRARQSQPAVCCDPQPRSSVYCRPANSVAADEAAEIEQHGEDSDHGAYCVDRAETHIKIVRKHPAEGRMQ